MKSLAPVSVDERWAPSSSETWKLIIGPSSKRRPSFSSVCSVPSSTSKICPRLHQWSATYPGVYSTSRTRMSPAWSVRQSAFPDSPGCSVGWIVLQSVVQKGMFEIFRSGSFQRQGSCAPAPRREAGSSLYKMLLRFRGGLPRRRDMRDVALPIPLVAQLSARRFRGAHFEPAAPVDGDLLRKDAMGCTSLTVERRLGYLSARAPRSGRALHARSGCCQVGVAQPHRLLARRRRYLNPSAALS